MSRSPVGALIRQWRGTRRLSQQALALEAEVSARHLSFIENGRSQPSARMLRRLAEVLELGPRDENALLLAGGFAPAHRQTDLSSKEMAPIRRTLNLILESHEPSAAVVLDRRYDLLMSNRAGQALTQAFCADVDAVLADGPPNLLRLTFHPRGLRPHIVNWRELARAILGRSLREAQVDDDPELRRVLSQVRHYEGVAEALEALDIATDPPLLVPTHFRRGDTDVKLLSTITTLGTAYDITLQELRIETFYPLDEPLGAEAR
jgi:transcriptional regulator with XRE-family HTH domain